MIFLLVLVFIFLSRQLNDANNAMAGVEEVANGDALFWLSQGNLNNRYITCTVSYSFDTPLDETVVKDRLKDLIESYSMFNRNITEIDGLPYWQNAKPEWRKNFRMLDTNESLEAIRIAADTELSQVSKMGQGVPLFRAYLSNDRRQLVFIWHHAISDFEGMFNKHALHLFGMKNERTKFGYQITDADLGRGSVAGSLALSKILKRPIGFEKSEFDVKKVVLPIKDNDLYNIGMKSGLGMSDIFSFITTRAVTLYYESLEDKDEGFIKPIVSPLSLRKNSLALDEGNNRAVKYFPLVFPLESISKMYERIRLIPKSTNSYDSVGKAMKIARKLSVLEMPLRRIGSPDYISNYFPLADMSLHINEAKLTRHSIRVPMMPFEQSKFAWSNYDGETQLYLHTDPKLVDSTAMLASAEQSIEEVLLFLKQKY